MPTTTWTGEFTISLEDEQRDCVERHTGMSPNEATERLVCEVRDSCPQGEECGLGLGYKEDSYTDGRTGDPMNDIEVDIRRIEAKVSCERAGDDADCVGRTTKAAERIGEFLSSCEEFDDQLQRVAREATAGARQRADELRAEADLVVADASVRAQQITDRRQHTFRDAWFSSETA